MGRRFRPFVIRYRRLGGDRQRIEIEHIQSGDRIRTASLAAATAWIDMQQAERANNHQQGESIGDSPLGSVEHA